MYIDERINKIMEKMEKISCEEEVPPKWNPPLKLQIVERYEKEHGITLPEDYKRFITTVASSGTAPFYGLYRLGGKLPKYDPKADVSKKFLYTIRTPLDIAALSEEEYDAIYEEDGVDVDTGYVLLCHEGCGMYSILIVNTEDEDTFGTVWYYDLANDTGIWPLIHPITNKTMGFLDWLEYYVDEILELDEDDDDCFSYGRLAGKVEG